MVVLNNGSKYEGTVPQEPEYALGDRVLKYGCEGQDVKLMQELLTELGYDLGSYGCDGDFGDCTELAVKLFQETFKLEVDGELGVTTLAVLLKAVDEHRGTPPSATAVLIQGGNCYIRTKPNTDGKILGVAHRGGRLKYAGETSEGGWHSVAVDGGTGWVSGKYSKVE